jgi:hypothetical protein
MTAAPDIAALVKKLRDRADFSADDNIMREAAATLEAVAKERDELQQINLRQSLTE